MTNYIYSALLLHSAGKEISEASLTKVIEAAGDKPDHAMVKALVSSLEGVNIDEAIKQSAAVAMPAAAAPAAEAKKEEKKSEDEDKKRQEEAVEGLSSLFG